ncbi:transcriptional regulator [Paenibacillus sp. 598K]|uniref:helix-turn-helix transcriptional regulator n=1 Tax=Paenibacillus sp. 598K TaxID=1117987 RepID=UPI000FFA718C|nr:helix-turn-helix transcriptional regulator [Paenibacillus sp. 598K]GBF73764.1 transcriptional regulator [Paenibacillus sp. 598K]
MEDVTSKTSLGEFLRSRRGRLTPEDVGLRSFGRRRTSGLRREEVAQLAFIGTSWYTALEQGRSVNPSEDVLNNIAKALRLTEDERQHLHLLAKPIQQEREADQHIPVGLTRTIKALDPNPAFVLGRYWDLLAWNKAAQFVFRLPSFENPKSQRINWIRYLLTELGASIEDWESGAKVLLAHFRADYARFPDDARFKELIEELMQISRLFREIWPLHEVQAVTNRHKRRYDPRIGEMEFEHVTLQPPTNPDLKMMVYTASTGTAARLQRLLGGDHLEH